MCFVARLLIFSGLLMNSEHFQDTYHQTHFWSTIHLVESSFSFFVYSEKQDYFKSDTGALQISYKFTEVQAHPAWNRGPVSDFLAKRQHG
jgi:hypothetical protein